MTPRLKGLLADFGISILILVADKVSESRDESTVGFGEKPKRFHRGPKVPKTRMKAARQREQSRKDAETYADSIRLRPIPQTALSINGWYRNPFTSDPIGQHAIGIGITNAPIDEKIALLNNLEQYNVEIFLEFGGNKIVEIDGKRFREGEYLNDILIEKIENRQITFRMGKIQVIKEVGG